MKRIVTYIALTTLIFTACNNSQPKAPETDSDLIEITKDQVLTENIEFGTPSHILFESNLLLTGKIVPDINGSAIISAPVNGMTKKIYVQKGQYVKAGDVILEIGGSTLIDLQQATTTSSAKLQQLKSDFDRISTLYQENIKTEKEYLRSESEYKAELANFSALKLKLQNIGLNLKNVESGNYASTYKIKTPIDGQISDLNITIGEFISPQQHIAKIINLEKTQLQLAVFERDFPKIKTGQKVLFKTAGESDYYSSATITRISRILNTNTKSFDCFAKISEKNNSSFIINQLVSAKVIIESDSMLAIPQAAIATSGNSHYVFVIDSENDNSFLLNKIKVQVGRISNNYIEISDFDNNKPILLSGTYNINID